MNQMHGLEDCLRALSGAQWVGANCPPVQRVTTDSRALRPGDLFVALRGERFDGHAFLAQAKAQGAVAALACEGLSDAGLPGVQVPDSRLALGELARRWRQKFELPVIAVTGSNGKTTVTQMAAAILRAQAGDAAHATEGNFNNDIGLPLTLLRLRPEHRLSVVELGMNHPGEIAYLADIARPTVALVNNAQREHLEFMNSVAAVAAENGSVIGALGPDGVAVFPSDDAFSPLWHQLAAGRRTLTFSDQDRSADLHLLQADWRAGAWDLVLQSPTGQAGLRLHIAGRHNLRNALAAAACALAAGAPLQAVCTGLGQFAPVGGRSRALSLQWQTHAMTLIDDSYNANPDSVRAAIEVLVELAPPRCLVLGDMGEVGDQGLAFHEEVLQHAEACGLEQVHVAGDWMHQASGRLLVAKPERRLRHWSDMAALQHHLLQQCQAPTGAPHSMLIKGSRFMRMERLVQALQTAAEPATPTEQDPHHAA